MTYTPLAFEFSDDFTMSENSVDAPGIVVDPPLVSATNSDTESWRIARVMAAWGSASAAVALLSHRYQRQWAGAIVELNDHKGTLEVTWRDEQSRMLFEGVIMGAWERAGEHSGAHALA